MGATEFIALDLLEDAFLFTRRLMIKRARMGWWISNLLYVHLIRLVSRALASPVHEIFARLSLIYFKFRRFCKTKFLVINLARII